ncbi:helix-turn-helix domain-containing protein [Streptomyces sp. NBC_00193]|uniref:helix-turn-helix domain-containing protein n=1 Tax=Streptomyces sp. NBC_00193 TaxID=2975675 RepID=UPI00225584F3|nr:helix-turn-helix domain-containing protein [Streptomyces sp. NBC_00193]MCX5296846.1 helix-turn-helix domain-containing protein [Streptomyces sp. NBC_00193]
MSTAAMSVAPVLCKVEAAAELLSLGRSTVYELMAAGELPFVKVGRARRIRRTDIDAFAAQLQPQSV